MSGGKMWPIHVLIERDGGVEPDRNFGKGADHALDGTVTLLVGDRPRRVLTWSVIRDDSANDALVRVTFGGQTMTERIPT